MGRADLLVGVEGFPLLVALALALLAGFVGRREVALVGVASALTPLEWGAAWSALPRGTRRLLSLRPTLLLLQLAITFSVLGWGGLFAGGVAAIAAGVGWRAWWYRSLQLGLVEYPQDDDYMRRVRWMWLELALTASAIALVAGILVFRLNQLA